MLALNQIWPRFCLIAAISTLWLRISFVNCDTGGVPPTYFSIPFHDHELDGLYMTLSPHGEVVVSKSSRGSDLRPSDYITHIDGYRILAGGLDAFVKSGESEVAVPIVDTNNLSLGGAKLAGFVLLSTINPKKISVRRGEISFDMNEQGGQTNLHTGNVVVTAAGVQSITDDSYVPPIIGSGKCITGKDCFAYNGTCVKGACVCNAGRLGSFCQMYKSNGTSVGDKVEEAFKQSMRGLDNRKHPNSIDANSQTSHTTITSTSTTTTTNANTNAASTGSTTTTTTSTTSSTTASDLPAQENAAMKMTSPLGSGDERIESKTKEVNDDIDTTKHTSEATTSTTEEITEEQGENEGGVHMSGKGKAKAKAKAKAGVKKVKAKAKVKVSEEAMGGADTSNTATTNAVPETKKLTISDLYGEGKAYPEPYPAGKIPHEMAHMRYTARHERKVFKYSIRFRSAPFGVAFDMTVPSGTRVQKVLSGQQAALSDVQVGDYLVAIDTFNTTVAPPKVSQTLLTQANFPVILVFETRGIGPDPKEVEKKQRERTVNITIIYPPTLISTFQARVSEWSPGIDVNSHGASCPVYYLTAPSDQFGCSATAASYDLKTNITDIYSSPSVAHNADSNSIDDSSYLMTKMLVRLARERGIGISPHSMAITRRGVCTFVDKAKTVASGKAEVGLVVNTDNEFLDLPSGKESTDSCTSPFALVRDVDGRLVHMEALKASELIAIVSSSTSAMTDACQQLQTLSEDIIDAWPHSVPPVSQQDLAKAVATHTPLKTRGLADEGGRVALGGENGWAFFDYHLAMFGPQEVPLGPMRFVMAQPPHGCDPNAYTVRISGAIVGILRGGGCTFGIKVINAQKLGAKAVAILNTNDVNTMRLMALPDEIPLINIPTIMVSRRLSYYLEVQLKQYYLIDQHFMSIQPTGLFGEYEKKNTVKLPPRLPNK